MTNAELTARETNEAALLDAAERLLVDVGHAGITTRRLAETAGINHGLVHYYFGSMENVLGRALERFTARLIERQRAMYADPSVPFVEKWRQAMRYLDDDATYQKVWFELQALAWNRPGFAGPVAEARVRLVRGTDRCVRAGAARARDRRSDTGAGVARRDVQRGA